MGSSAAIALGQHHMGLDDLAALLVGRADHGAFPDVAGCASNAASTSGPAML